jgi:putative transposase
MKAEGSMSNTRKHYSAELKAKIAVAGVKGQQTVNEIASDYGVHPTQVSLWKKQLLSEAASLFGSSHSKKSDDTEELQSRLYQEIGQLKVELDWLKKKSGLDR